MLCVTIGFKTHVPGKVDDTIRSGRAAVIDAVQGHEVVGARGAGPPVGSLNIKCDHLDGASRQVGCSARLVRPVIGRRVSRGLDAVPVQDALADEGKGGAELELGPQLGPWPHSAKSV